MSSSVDSDFLFYDFTEEPYIFHNLGFICYHIKLHVKLFFFLRIRLVQTLLALRLIFDAELIKSLIIGVREKFDEI